MTLGCGPRDLGAPASAHGVPRTRPLPAPRPARPLACRALSRPGATGPPAHTNCEAESDMHCAARGSIWSTRMPRLFAALRPPEPVRDALIDTMEALDNARWQADEQLHLTLRFIGEVDNRRAEDVATALSRVRTVPFPVELSGVGHFARRGMPTAIWARVAPTPELAALQRQVEHACRAAGLPPETRAFVPHVTIARLDRSAAPIGGWIARHNTLRARWLVRGFALYESRIGHAGAAYVEIERFPAPG